MRTTLLVLLLLTLPACFVGRSSRNEPLDKLPLDKLEPGKSTAKDAVELLGAPNNVVELDRRSAYYYVFQNKRTTGLSFLLLLTFVNEDTRTDRIWLFFDENQTLTHFGESLEGANVKGGLPWRDIYKEEGQNAG